MNIAIGLESLQLGREAGRGGKRSEEEGKKHLNSSVALELETTGN